MTLLALLTVGLVLAFVPVIRRGPLRHRAPRAAGFSSLQVWLTLLIGAVGFGGMFAMYSYIAPTVTDVTGCVAPRCRCSCWPSASAAILGTMLGGVAPTGRCCARS